MPETPEEKAREKVDEMLHAAGWHVQDLQNVNIHVNQGVAVREFPLSSGHGFADYILYVDGKATGVIEAKKAGTTLTGVEIQSDKYKHGLPDSLPAWFRPLPFCYQTTGVETRFTNGFDPDPRSTNLFFFHRPYKARLRADELQDLADAIHRPPHHLNQDKLWQAYAALEKDKVRGANAKRILTDLVALVRFALEQDNELVPFAERVNANFAAWLAQHANSGRRFSEDQEMWLQMIRDHIAGNHSIETADFELSPFVQSGGLGRFYEVFGDRYKEVLEELNNSLVA